ncbi:MAG TPA: hypothetical protein VFG54_19420 [Prolixibacteraceae bacterium]|nr:hypothetical protein [Prolixibacteraceae bacterium]
MKEDIEFQNIGKNTLYKAPDGFFEQISERTLQRAKLRQQIQRRNLILLKTLTGAASLAAVVFLGYFLSEPGKPEQKLVIHQNKPQTEQVMKQKPIVLKEPIAAIQEKDSIEKTSPEVKSGEDMMDVIADLSDEELMQLAAMYKADPFIEEAIQ